LVRSSTSRHADETGSSLVEVSVAMVILAVFPLAGLLDAGLRAATSIGEYDAARALANEKLGEVRALPYSRPGGAGDSAVERYAPPGPPGSTESDLGVSVRTAFVDENLSVPADSPPTGQMRVEVLVTWDAGSYSTVGIVSGELP
jgi:hypothetical protein